MKDEKNSNPFATPDHLEAVLRAEARGMFREAKLETLGALELGGLAAAGAGREGR